MITEDFLETLGVQCANGSDKEIKAYCPVHHLVKGRASNSAKWYMNRATGAWLCFSCQQRGSLHTLVDLLNLDRDVIGKMPVEIMKARVDAKAERDEAPVDDTPKVHVSEYGFRKNPLPPESLCKLRKITLDMCRLYNVRWSADGKYFMLPIYSFAGELMGWQQKSVGYFMNVPDAVKKSHSLFGYQQFLRGKAILVESPLDVVRMASEGIEGGMATYGAYVSNEQLDAVGLATKEVVLAFDNDDAGQKANERCRTYLQTEQACKVWVVEYPKKALGKDPGEWPTTHLHAAITRATSLTPSRLRVPAALRK